MVAGRIRDAGISLMNVEVSEHCMTKEAQCSVMADSLVIIPAHTNSTRLPNKINQKIQQHTMLEHVVSRVKKAGFRVHVAWPPPDQDVLSRFVSVAEQYPSVQTFLRITSDCPLIDPGVIRFVYDLACKTSLLEFVGTHRSMDGLDVEVFSRQFLFMCDARTTLMKDREHVTPWMRLYGRLIAVVDSPIRWSVDDADGLDFVRRVYDACRWCADAVPRHTNSRTSIGGSDRRLVIDLHQTDDGGLVECRAADLLSSRMGGPVYDSLDAR